MIINTDVLQLKRSTYVSLHDLVSMIYTYIWYLI